MPNDDLRRRALGILRSRNGIRASELGMLLWGALRDVPILADDSQQQNRYCRPAGKVLRALERGGLARVTSEGPNWLWRITGKGQDELNKDNPNGR